MERMHIIISNMGSIFIESSWNLIFISRSPKVIISEITYIKKWIYHPLTIYRRLYQLFFIALCILHLSTSLVLEFRSRGWNHSRSSIDFFVGIQPIFYCRWCIVGREW